MRWDPDQYRRFANERDRAFLDLTSRIGADAPRHVVDVGCGPGNLTGLLASRWPQAVIEGIDSSPEMIAAATNVPRVSFAVGDAADWQPTGDVDVVVSNAALQWIPRHQELMAKWAYALPRGGWLAVQGANRRATGICAWPPLTRPLHGVPSIATFRHAG